MSNKEEKNPSSSYQDGGLASILSYNVPEPISYSGRNFIELKMSKDYFKSSSDNKPLES